MSEQYWIRYGSDNWQQVTKAEYVRAERSAGFHNTLGEPDEPATSGFSSWREGVDEVSGRVGNIRDSWCNCQSLIGQPNYPGPWHRLGCTMTCPIEKE